MGKLALIKGSGEIASSIANTLNKIGISVMIIDEESPKVVRRGVSYAQVMFFNDVIIEDVRGKKALDLMNAFDLMDKGIIPIIKENIPESLEIIRPMMIIDTQGIKNLEKKIRLNLDKEKEFKRLEVEEKKRIKASKIKDKNKKKDVEIIPFGGEKKNEKEKSLDIATIVDKMVDSTITSIKDAPIVIGVGSGFEAGVDCDLLIETSRGHDMARIIHQGQTGLKKESIEDDMAMALKSPCGGRFLTNKKIGDTVRKGEIVARVMKHDEKICKIKSPISGMMRGLIFNGLDVDKNMICIDIDPRKDKDYAFTFSDRARAISGNVLAALLIHAREHDIKIL